jgi:hypothetical protein
MFDLQVYMTQERVGNKQVKVAENLSGRMARWEKDLPFEQWMKQ